MISIGAAVKRIRRRTQKTQVAFASMLGCQRNTVSRWERGAVIPGTLQLIQLKDLAVGDEREPILAELGRLMSAHVVIEAHLTPECGEGRLGRARRIERLAKVLGEKKLEDLGFRMFVAAVAEVMQECETVDVSVVEILRLWAAHSKKPEASEYLRDALGFLRAKLWVNLPKADGGV